LKRRAGLPVEDASASASRSSAAISAASRRLRASPNTKSTRFFSHQAIIASRAKPESARKRMRVFGQRART